MNRYREHIGDGISLSVINTTKFKAGALHFSICTPLCERDYLRSLLLAGIMRRGCGAFPSMAQINKRLDMLYGASVDIQSVIRGDVLCFTVSAELLEPRFSIDGTDISGGVIDTVAEILLNPIKCGGTFPEDTVRAEKALVRDILASEANDTGVYASTRLKEIMSRQRFFPTLEYMLATIDSVTPEELSDYHTSLLCKPIRISYVGGERAEGICEKIRRALSAFESNGKAELPSLSPQAPCPFSEVVEERKVSQSKLGLGLRTGTVLGMRDAPAAVMLNEIFGASPASKLFLGVRERLGLCYYCHSSLSLSSGSITVSAGIEGERRELVTSSILGALDEIKAGKISDVELAAARKSLDFGYMQIYDSVHALISFYFLRDLFGISQTVEECREGILSVSAEDISSLACKTAYDTCFFLSGTEALDE